MADSFSLRAGRGPFLAEMLHEVFLVARRFMLPARGSMDAYSSRQKRHSARGSCHALRHIFLHRLPPCGARYFSGAVLQRRIQRLDSGAIDRRSFRMKIPFVRSSLA